MFSLELENSFAVQRGTIYFDLERDEIDFFFFFLLMRPFFLSESKNNKYICLLGREIRAHQLEASLHFCLP